MAAALWAEIWGFLEKDLAFTHAAANASSFVRTVTGFLNSIFAGPFQATFFIFLVCAYFCYVSALTSGYWSWVDRLWSIVPSVYLVVFAIYLPTPRLVLMAVLGCFWGIRLTFNFWRKGGFGEEEDYRWEVLRKWFAAHDPLHPLGREVFQLTFVAFYQHLLLWLIAAPSALRVYYYQLLYRNTQRKTLTYRLVTEDYVLGGLFLVLLFFETIADETQWQFQKEKYKLSPKERIAKGGDFARGFCTTGVFRYSRHLNFFCEQAMWWTIYAFSLVPTLYDDSGTRIGITGVGSLVNFSILGPMLLSLLFLGSTTFTENLSISKYPVYQAYQQTTSRLIPWFAGASLDSEQGKRLVEKFSAPIEASKKK